MSAWFNSKIGGWFGVMGMFRAYKDPSLNILSGMFCALYRHAKNKNLVGDHSSD